MAAQRPDDASNEMWHKSLLIDNRLKTLCLLKYPVDENDKVYFLPVGDTIFDYRSFTDLLFSGAESWSCASMIPSENITYEKDDVTWNVEIKVERQSYIILHNIDQVHEADDPMGHKLFKFMNTMECDSLENAHPLIPKMRGLFQFKSLYERDPIRRPELNADTNEYKLEKQEILGYLLTLGELTDWWTDLHNMANKDCQDLNLRKCIHYLANRWDMRYRQNLIDMSPNFTSD